jgi:3-ketosteroid 9alpha-monooxygenase subunit B
MNYHGRKPVVSYFCGLEVVQVDSEACQQSEPVEPEEIIVRKGQRLFRANHRAGDTVLETLRRASIDITTQCEQAYCGSCIFELVRGEVELRLNSVLSEEDLASGMRLACQGVPRGAIVEIEIF